MPLKNSTSKKGNAKPNMEPVQKRRAGRPKKNVTKSEEVVENVVIETEDIIEAPIKEQRFVPHDNYDNIYESDEDTFNKDKESILLNKFLMENPDLSMYLKEMSKIYHRNEIKFSEIYAIISLILDQDRPELELQYIQEIMSIELKTFYEFEFWLEGHDKSKKENPHLHNVNMLNKINAKELLKKERELENKFFTFARKIGINKGTLIAKIYYNLKTQGASYDEMANYFSILKENCPWFFREYDVSRGDPSQESTDAILNDTNLAILEDKITIKELLENIKKGISLEKVSEEIIYSPIDEFYSHDFIDKYTNALFDHRELNVFDAAKKAKDIMEKDLLRVLRVITITKPIVFLKSNCDKKFDSAKYKDVIGNFCGNTFSVISRDPKDPDSTTTRQYSIFSTADGNIKFQSPGHNFTPYHPENPPKFNKKESFNTFPGVKARYIPKLSEEQVKKLEPLLLHIKTVWANNKEEDYNYIMNWIAKPLRELEKTEICLVLEGEEGSGKGLIVDFIQNEVYGDDLSTVTELEDMVHSFNGVCYNKMFLIVNEGNESTNILDAKKVFNSIKSIITDKKQLTKLKYIDAFQAKNFTNMIILTNNQNSVVISFKDRRYALFRTSSVHLGDTKYFETMAAYFKNNKDLGDIFYSYLRSEEHVPYVNLRNIPMTEAREDQLEASKGKTTLFTECLLEGQIILEKDDIIIDTENKYVWISKSYLYELFKEWCDDKYGKNCKYPASITFNKEFKKSICYLFKIKECPFDETKRKVGLANNIHGYVLKGEIVRTLNIKQSDDISISFAELMK